jgi:hypothetical protein
LAEINFTYKVGFPDRLQKSHLCTELVPEKSKKKAGWQGPQTNDKMVIAEGAASEVHRYDINYQ